MLDYCPSCGSDDIESYMNGDNHCADCGAYWIDEDEDTEDA